MDSFTAAGERYTVTGYFRLVDLGLLAPDDRVELLEGLVVAMPPQTPPHESAVRRAERTLHRLGDDVLLSSQSPFVAGAASVPEPDLAVLPGPLEEGEKRHPTRALLVVEIAETSLAQDRLTKARIYARADVANYWIVNLRDQVVEWFGDPVPDAALYRTSGIASGPMHLPLDAFAGVTVTAAELLPAS